MRHLRGYLDTARFAAALVALAAIGSILPLLVPAESWLAPLYILVIPSLALLALLPLARISAEAGPATLPKGELDHLLRQKRDRLLELSQPEFETIQNKHGPVSSRQEPPAPADVPDALDCFETRIQNELGPAHSMQKRPAQADVSDALDRLVEWKRAVKERV